MATLPPLPPPPLPTPPRCSSWSTKMGIEGQRKGEAGTPLARGLRGAFAGSCGRFPAARAGARRSGPELELGLEAFIITGRTRSRRVQSGARAPLPRCRPGLCLRRCASARRWLPVQLVADAAGRRAWGWATSKGTRSGSSSSSSPGKSEMRFTGEPDEIQPRPSASGARGVLTFQKQKKKAGERAFAQATQDRARMPVPKRVIILEIGLV